VLVLVDQDVGERSVCSRMSGWACGASLKQPDGVGQQIVEVHGVRRHHSLLVQSKTSATRRSKMVTAAARYSDGPNCADLLG